MLGRTIRSSIAASAKRKLYKEKGAARGWSRNVGRSIRTRSKETQTRQNTQQLLHVGLQSHNGETHLNSIQIF